MGQALGCGAFLSALNREKVGKFSIEDSIPMDQVDASKLRTLRDALPPVPIVGLDNEQTVSIREGRAVQIDQRPAGHVAGLLSPEGSIIGMARVAGNLLQPECVIPYEALHDLL